MSILYDSRAACPEARAALLPRPRQAPEEPDDGNRLDNSLLETRAA